MEQITIQNIVVTLDPEFARLFDHGVKPSKLDYGLEQYAQSMRATGTAKELLVWQETGVLVDGYRTLSAHERLTDEERANVVLTPKLVSFPTRAEALKNRFLIQDATREWNPKLAMISILKNPTLRESIEAECDKRKTDGVRQPIEKSGTKWFHLGQYARCSASVAYKLSVILSSPKAEEHEKAILATDRSQRSIQSVYQECRDAKERKETKGKIEAPLPPYTKGVVDVIISVAAHVGLQDITPRSVGALITSPPYPHPVLYEKFGMKWEGYQAWLADMTRTFKSAYEVLDTGAFAIINIGQTFVSAKDKAADEGDVWKGKRTCSNDLITMMKGISFEYWDTFTWWKQNADGNWPKFGSEDNPQVNYALEDILVFRKPGERTTAGEYTITSKDRYKWLMGGLWDFLPQRTKNGPCPYPFPEELPYRCIQLYSTKGDVILDPYCGNGTTCVVAKKLGRHWIGIDANEETAKHAAWAVDQTNLGDPVERSMSTLDIIASAAARRMMACPKCREKNWDVNPRKENDRPICPGCGDQVVPTKGERKLLPLIETLGALPIAELDDTPTIVSENTKVDEEPD